MLSSFQVSIIVVNVIFPILAGIAVGLRFKARFVKHVSLQADDFLIVLSEVNIIAALDALQHVLMASSVLYLALLADPSAQLSMEGSEYPFNNSTLQPSL